MRMSNLENERDDRDEDSHEDRGISKIFICNKHKTFKAHFSIRNDTERSNYTSTVHQICSIILCTVNAVFHGFNASDFKWMIILPSLCMMGCFILLEQSADIHANNSTVSFLLDNCLKRLYGLVWLSLSLTTI